MIEMIRAMLLIFMAEMGDKTQLLAMAFATQYSVGKIVTGVAIGAFLNHGIAIILGSLLANLIPTTSLQIVAGLLFLYFAFASLTVEDDEDAEVKTKFGPVVTVAVAFFVGELGDKTQLTALGLSTDALYPFLVLIGTTLGMVFTSMVGIFVGRKLGKKIPEDKLKLGAFVIFLFFGAEKLYGNLLYDVPLYITLLVFAGLLVYASIRVPSFLQDYRSVTDTAFTRRAEALKQLRTKGKQIADQMCVGCKVCDGKSCLVGYLKYLLSLEHPLKETDVVMIHELKNKNFSKEEARSLLLEIVAYYDKFPEEFLSHGTLEEIRHPLEMIAYGRIIHTEDLESYKKEVEVD